MSKRTVESDSSFSAKLRKLSEVTSSSVPQKPAITHLALKGPNILDILLSGVRIAYLERLELHSLTHDELLKIKKTLADKSVNLNAFCDLQAVLELLIWPDTRNELTHLKLHKTFVKSNRRQMEGIAKLFPNIKKLEIMEAEVQPQHLQDVCNHFINLVHLDISTAKITSVKGISIAENLEFLSVMNANFEDKKALEEIFKLKKLRHLNISSNKRHCQHFSYYMACNDSLPELECLDIAFNTITEEPLLELVSTHPKLKVISLIGTPLDRGPQFEDLTPHLLTMENLDQALKALNFYKGAEHINKIKYIFPEISKILLKIYEMQSEANLRECFHSILPTSDNRHYWTEFQTHVVNCIFELTRDGRVRMFNSDEIQKLIDTFMDDSFWPEENLELTDSLFQIYTKIWSIINTNKVLQTSPENLRNICLKAASMAKITRRIATHIDFPFQSAMLVLGKCLVKEESKANGVFEILGRDERFQKYLLACMADFPYSQNVRLNNLCHAFLNVTYALICDAEQKNHNKELIVQAVSVWTLTANKYEGNDEMQVLFLRKILDVVQLHKQNHHDLLQNPRHELYMKAMFSGKPLLRHLGLNVLFAIYALHQCQAEKEKFSEYYRAAEAVTAGIIKIVRYMPLEEDENGLPIIGNLRIEGSEEVKKFAQFILDHLPNGHLRHQQVKQNLQPDVIVID